MQIKRKEDRLKTAHEHTINNRGEIEQSHVCVCVSCKRRYPALEVMDYIDGGLTAICPFCDCDAVIGDASGINLTDAFLAELHKHYF